MSGDIEEPFRFGFQGDSLHSGSISFGRFEAESLSWERRSSFSHNRYLEEVEKYSKPGSVTEKKAYFEAHFRKKALLTQNSSEWKNGVEYQTSENDGSHDLEEFENVKDRRHFTCFDESPDSSRYDEQSEVLECEREDTEALYSERHVQCVTDNANDLAIEPEHVKSEEAHQTENENFVSFNTEPDIVETLVDEVVQVDVTSEAIDPSASSRTSEKDDSASSGIQQVPSFKLMPASESKVTEPKVKSLANVTQVQRSILSEAPKGSAKPKRRESEDLRITKTEKKLSHSAAPITRSVGKTSKSEDVGGSKAKVIRQQKSYSFEKEPQIVKEVESRSLGLLKSLPGARETPNRLKQTVNSSKASTNQSAVVFSFKSDQRAGRRKEETTEAETKQFRRSLNFKAKPMPSFYTGSARNSDRNKVVQNEKKSSKVCTASSKAANASDRPEASGLTNSSVLSDTCPNSPTSVTSRSYPSETGKRNAASQKKEREKKKDPIFSQNNSQLEGEVKTLEGQHKVEGARSGSDMLRKVGKCAHSSNGSKLGHGAVGIAS